MLLLCTLVPACVQREVESPIIGLGDSPTMGGKDSAPGSDDPADSGVEDESDSGGGSKGDVTGALDSGGSGESSSGEPPEDGSSGGGDESSSGETTDGPPTMPTGDPMWAHCSGNDDCESGLCVVVEVGGAAADGYCTDTCNSAAFDCDDPNSGSASPVCITASEGENICALDCSAPATCPAGMSCIMIEEAGVPVCI
jgi:hypothetical protein